MKRFISFTINLLLCISFSIAQESYRDGEVMRIDLKNEKVPVLIDGEWEEIYFNRVEYMMENDIYSFFRIKDVSTPLEKRAFEKTQEYQDYVTKLKEIKQKFLSTYYYIAFDIEGNIPYDIERDCFTFRIGFPNDSRVKRPNYICFDDEIFVSLPSKYVVINQEPFMGRYTLSQFVLTPEVPEELALRIDKEMKKSDCAYRLMFAVKFDTLIPKPSGATTYFSKNYLLTKAVGLFIYDIETNSLVADFDSIFKEPAPAPKKATGNRTTTRTKTRARR